MVARTQLQLLGTALVPSKKDPTKVYNTVSFLDGVQSVNILTDSFDVYNRLSKLPQLTLLDVTLDVSAGRYTYIRLTDAVPVSE